MADCVFCEIVAGRAPAVVVGSWPDAIAIVPLRPVTEGHVLVLPRVHVDDYLADPALTGLVVRCAASIAPWPSNMITSAGRAATQTIMHLHVHIVPRLDGDGLALPWSRP